MTIESQTGATRYRVNPRDKCRVQVQHGAGKRWQNVTNDDGSEKVFADPKGAALWVMMQGKVQP